jgi:hypothetical protein
LSAVVSALIRFAGVAGGVHPAVWTTAHRRCPAQ